MNAENLIVDQRCDWHVVEDLGAVAPDVHATVLSEALIVEPVDLCRVAGLVVSADESDALWVAYFERQEKQESLNRVEAAIDKVSQEYVVRLRALTTDAEELH